MQKIIVNILRLGLCTGLITVLALGSLRAQSDTNFMYVRDYAKGLINIRWIDDTNAFKKHLASLSLDFASLSDTCTHYANQASELRKQMLNSGSLHDGTIIIDEQTSIPDYGLYDPLISNFISLARRESRFYANLEKELQEQKAREEKARQQRIAKQKQEADNRTQEELRQTIERNNSRIETLCLGNETPDKGKIKELRDILYSYIPIRNRYDLKVTQATRESIQTYNEFIKFQNHLIDSVLGPNSYRSQIEYFPTMLKSSIGKNNSEVYRSYTKNFKKTQVAANFRSLSEYQDYITELRTIATIQKHYLQAVQLRDQIAANTETIQTRSNKSHRDLLLSYKEVLETVKLIPTFSTLNGAELFTESLLGFIDVQEQYIIAIDRLESITARGNEIVKQSTRLLSDIATAYKSLASKTIFTPSFKTAEGARFFMQSLDDFETLQQAYFEVIELRKEIQQKTSDINDLKSAPAKLASCQRSFVASCRTTPDFNSIPQSKAFINNLHHIIMVQERYMLIAENNTTINALTENIKHLTESRLSNIEKAYTKVQKSIDFTFSATTESEVEKYILKQENFIAIQKQFIKKAKSSDAKLLEKQLKGEKSVERILLAIGIK